jgi:ectoine hydroxylase-related dioxygenase (phytanoyl-CoA dioxygenase family)
MNQAAIQNLDNSKNCSVSDKDRAFYKKNGYLIIRNVLSENECLEYIKEAHRVSKGTLQEPNIYRKSEKFLEMLTDQRIMDYVDSLLEWRMIPIGDIFFFAKSSDGGQEEGSSAHQDNYFQKAEWGAFVACGVYLDKANLDNGSLIVYPGTHWLGDAKCEPAPNFKYGKNGEVLKANPIGNNCEIPAGYEEYQIDMNRGDIIIFHGHLIHKAPKNKSKKSEYRHVNYLKLIKNGKGFWPGWSERRVLIERKDFNEEFRIV